MCYRQDDCGKLTSKDQYNTRRSKQNTYHVANKNIAPSKVTDRSRRKRGCLPGAYPSLGFWLSLNILGCHGHLQAQALATPYFIVHKSFTQNLKNFTTQNSTENHISSVSERKQNHQIRYCNELILYLIWC